jgi:hypothetical protein
LLALSDAAWRMWGCGLIYCQANLTDGVIPEHAIQTFGVRAKNKAAIAEELCSSLVPGKGPLWEKTDGGYRVHDYFDWNDSRETILAGRAKAKARLDRFRGNRAPAAGTATPDATRSETRFTTPPKTRSEQVSTTTTTLPRDQAEQRAADAAVGAADLQRLWNDLTTAPIPRCKGLSQTRRRRAVARLRERPLGDWRDIIARIEASRFCRGEGGRGWVASFDWLLKEDTALMVLEGKYDDRASSPVPSAHVNGHASRVVPDAEETRLRYLV